MFVQDVLPRYRAGEVWNVAGGYARNYLIPRGMAVPATRDQLQRAQKLRSVAEVRREAEVKDLRSFGEKVEGARLTLSARVGEEGRLYGSVTAAGIAEELTRLVGREVDRRLVQLPAPIKEVGEYQVPVRLPHGSRLHHHCRCRGRGTHGAGGADRSIRYSRRDRGGGGCSRHE